jgi:UDP-glucose 4-epimerase
MILLTGATGYIGSNTWIELLKESFQVVGVDSLLNSSIECLSTIAAISGENPIFLEGDIRDPAFLGNIFDKYPITHVIHLAALKDIHESVIKMDEYYDVNVRGLSTLLGVMRSHNCFKLIFSSSAAVYGKYAVSPISEMTSPNPSNYYGITKLEGELLLADEFKRLPAISSVSLRYFNVAGRHHSGLFFGVDSVKNKSLFSEIENVLIGKKAFLPIFGNDWGTSDGTCIRDYLHVSDIVNGHLDSLNLLDREAICVALNLGLGVGQSVYKIISSYEHIIGKLIPRKVTPRRSGDVAVSFADTNLASQLIGWSPKKTLLDMCFDSFSATCSVRR